MTTRHRTAAPSDDVDIVEKDRVVIGGFSDMDGDEAEKLVDEVLLGVPGYQGAYATNPAPVRFPGYGFESDPQSKVQSKNAGTQIVGVRKSLPEGTSPLQTCEQIEEDVD